MPHSANCHLSLSSPDIDSGKEKLSNFYTEQKGTDFLRKQLREQSLSVFIQPNQQ
jgi:hypothetical protein